MGERVGGPGVGPRTVRLVLRYDGTDYHGWQRQPHVPTVQETLERAIEEVTGERGVAHGSGRTDAGVHALGQVASFSTRCALPAYVLQRAINANLPDDVVVTSAADAPADFHARFSARRKTYVYVLRRGPVRDPLALRYSTTVLRELDVGRMRAAARRLVGRRDFRSFATQSERDEGTVRTLMALRVVRRPGGIVVVATADGFLMHMVRTLAGALVRVGDGRDGLERIDEVLAARDRSVAPAALPARGLFLWRVDY